MPRTRLSLNLPRGRVIAPVVLAGALMVPLVVSAADEFTDVPAGHLFEADIAWLADADITRGCNPPGNTAFCPDDPVTRGQMAAFLHRLATGKTVAAGTARSAETAGDSDLLDGLPVEEIQPRLSAQSDGIAGSTDETNSGLVEVNQITIQAPTDGFLLISGTGFINPGDDEIAYILRTLVNGTIVGLGGQNWSAYYVPVNSLDASDLSYTIAVPVGPGSHEVTQELGPRIGTATFEHNHETLTVMFLPGGQGSISLSAGTGGGPDAGSDD